MHYNLATKNSYEYSSYRNTSRKKGFILYAAIDGKAVLFEDSFGLCNSCCGDSWAFFPNVFV